MRRKGKYGILRASNFGNSVVECYSEDDPSDFAEIQVSEATPEAMDAAGFSTEFQSLISRVKAAVGDSLSRNKGDKFVNHKTSASILEAVRRIDPEEGSLLQFGDFVFGFVKRSKDKVIRTYADADIRRRTGLYPVDRTATDDKISDRLSALDRAGKSLASELRWG